MELLSTTSPEEVSEYVLNNPPPGWLGTNGPAMKNVQEGYREASNRYLNKVQWDGTIGNGRGIVTCGGGNTYTPCLWVLLSLLRKKLKCQLPIEVWHLGPQEIDEEIKRLLAPFDVHIRDAQELTKKTPCRILNGWELKTYAIKHSEFKDVIYLDVDNVPTRDPEFLFDTQQFRKDGAIIWGDFNYLNPQACLIFDVPYTRVKERETGQLVFDKEKVWKAIMLSHWYSENSDYYYKHSYGDKECIHMGFRRSNTPFADPPEMVGYDGVMNQHDFQGNIIFHHRNRRKWTLNIRKNKMLFPEDGWCIQQINELADQWSRTKTLAPEYMNQEKQNEVREKLANQNQPNNPDQMPFKTPDGYTPHDELPYQPAPKIAHDYTPPTKTFQPPSTSVIDQLYTPTNKSLILNSETLAEIRDLAANMKNQSYAWQQFHMLADYLSIKQK